MGQQIREVTGRIACYDLALDRVVCTVVPLVVCSIQLRETRTMRATTPVAAEQ